MTSSLVMMKILIRRTDGLHQESSGPVAEGQGQVRDEVQERRQERVQALPGQELRQTGSGEATLPQS